MRNALKTLTLCALILSGFNASEAAAPKDKKELIAEVRSVIAKARGFFSPFMNQTCLWGDISKANCILHPFACNELNNLKKKFTSTEYDSFENDIKITLNKRAGAMVSKIEKDKGDFDKLALDISIELAADAKTLKNSADALNKKIEPLKKVYKDITGKSCTK